MNENAPISEIDIQAYVDNQLDPARIPEVEAYLENHPEEATRVHDYRLLNQAICDLYDPVLDEKLPRSFTKHHKRRFRPMLFKAAASVAWLAVGGIIGWSAHPAKLMLAGNIDGQETHLVQPASFAHAIYSVENKHPVEVSAKDTQHLVAWLSKRLHTDIKAPDLSRNHYQLIGGRLLPSTNRMAAQFMYQHPDGTRITLYIRRGAWDNNKTAFHFSSQDGTSVLYWIDGEIGYALVGNLNKADLLKLSREVYQQIG